MRGKEVVIALCLLTAGAVAGRGIGPASPDIQNGRADVNAAGDGGSITTGDWTYSLPTTGVLWADRQGMLHDGDRPECLTPGTSTAVRFAAVEVRVGSASWRSVVWISCQ